MTLQIDELNKVLEALSKIEQLFGFGATIIVITLSVALVLTWKYLIKRTESIAQEASEQSLKKFQSDLDKELVKFQTKHQKQVDAIHETFQTFQRLTSMINFILKGDKFTQPLKPEEEISYMMKFRQEFKNHYNQNRLLFPKQLCEKIDTLIPIVEEFIETYHGGLFPQESEEEIQSNSEQNGGMYVAGIWGAGTFDNILIQLDQISKDIEIEFRKIYGTNE